MTEPQAPLRRPIYFGIVVRHSNRSSDHALGNSAGDRHAFRHGNHPVHREAL